MDFKTTAVSVLIMMVYALPGFILIKTKAINPDGISYFAKVLLFVFQPCLSLYSFNKADYTPQLLANMGMVFGVAIGVQALIITVLWLCFKNKFDDVNVRVASVAAAFGNVGFFGVPLLERLLPENPDALAYSATFIVSLNLMAWTLGCFVLTKDKNFLKVKKLFLNPPVLTLLIALPLFLTNTKLPTEIGGIVTVLGKMTTPMCMLILGMRLATVSFKQLFGDWHTYLSSAVKLVVLPFVTLGISKLIGLTDDVTSAFFILACCPSATVVLNLAEMFGSGQKAAANCILMSTLLCMITIPLMLLVL